MKPIKTNFDDLCYTIIKNIQNKKSFIDRYVEFKNIIRIVKKIYIRIQIVQYVNLLQKGLFMHSINFFFFFFIIYPLYAEKKVVSFSVVGDIMNHDLQIYTAYDPTCDCWNYKFSFEKVKPYLEETDITIGNLETTLPGERTMYSGYPQFGAPDALIDALSWSGFDILTLANNHCVDKGLKGLLRTKIVVKQKGLIPLGTFTDEEYQNKNFVSFYKKNQIVFAFLNFTYGTNGLAVPYPAMVNQIDLEELRMQIEYTKKQNPDVIILLLHYGKEYITSPNLYQKLIVQLAFKEGVDIVLGGHPHVLQPFELLKVSDKYGNEKQRLVVWSLGNFISNQKKPNTDGGMIFQFKVKKENQQILIYDLDYIPVYVSFNGKHRILPIHEYLYLSIQEPSKYVVKLNNIKYFIHFYPDKKDYHTEKMILFFMNSLEILKTLPKKLQIL